ncbi:hypothetical protein [Sphingobium yanoikuyae]|uniref:hypothetical protein n=1 Tax=Sphingobium yanoikuyae TaxID=13690 RepID=UPI00289A7DA4|nr:hypothetical protein [Sphingobium yanoikuyae]
MINDIDNDIDRAHLKETLVFPLSRILQRKSPLASKLSLGYVRNMGTTLRDFITQREAEIRDQQKALKAELRDLQVAKAALEAQRTPESGSGSATTLTIKDMAREILGAQPNGLNSSGILDGIKKTFGRDVERTSLSPQLSRLKEEGDLALDGDVWFTLDHYNAAQERRRANYDDPFKVSDRNPFDADLDQDVPF